MKKAEEEIIVIFLCILVVSTPFTFSALKFRIENGEIKPNEKIDKIILALEKIFDFFNLIPFVSAQNLGCCEIMKSGARCQISFEDECNTSAGSWYVNQSCENICRLGCCIDRQGFCNKNAIASQCPENSALKFIPGDQSCNQDPLCKYGCCSVGLQKIWTTNLTCSLVYGGFWDDSVSDELSCIQLAYQEQRGCCKSYAGCEYITAQECQAKGGAFIDKKCYENIPGCDCEGSETKKCVEGFPDLYKTDTCGNVYIDEIAQQCEGFCNPETNQCESGECSSIYSNFEDNTSFQNLKYSVFPPERKGLVVPHGSSWCVYDTSLDLGDGTSARGSRHWRRYCIYGKEYLEPCGEGKTSICVGVSGGCFGESTECLKKTTKSECESSSGCRWITMHSAVCIPNLWMGCANITDEKECNENPFCYWWEQWKDQTYPANVRNLLKEVGFDINKDLSEQTEKWYGWDLVNKPLEIHPQHCLPR
ncbi:MAG: hypothetical protein NZ889_01185, partial [Candidatus Pacearchaeota archaeon]|nr:hypothetical protein [Candidatus Pacearchaeota archaeon]